LVYHCSQRAIETVASDVPSGIRRMTFFTGFTFSTSCAFTGMKMTDSNRRSEIVFFIMIYDL